MIRKKTHYLAVFFSALTLVLTPVFLLQQDPEYTQLHSAAEEEVVFDEDGETLGSPFVHYESATHSYSIRVPSQWEIDDSREHHASDIIRSTNGRIVVSLASDTRFPMDTPDAYLFETMYNTLALDPSMRVVHFKQIDWKDQKTLFGVAVRASSTGQRMVHKYVVQDTDKDRLFFVTVDIDSSISHTEEKSLQSLIHSLVL